MLKNQKIQIKYINQEILDIEFNKALFLDEDYSQNSTFKQNN